MAPYCAIPRDYLSDTPLLRAMGFLVSQHGQLGAIPPPHFSARFPLGEHAKWRCDTPPPPQKRGISAILARYQMKTRQMGAIPPLCDTISKRYCAIWGGISHWAISHWAAKHAHGLCFCASKHLSVSPSFNVCVSISLHLRLSAIVFFCRGSFCICLVIHTAMRNKMITDRQK